MSEALGERSRAVWAPTGKCSHWSGCSEPALEERWSCAEHAAPLEARGARFEKAASAVPRRKKDHTDRPGSCLPPAPERHPRGTEIEVTDDGCSRGRIYDLAAMMDGGPWGRELRGDAFVAAVERARQVLGSNGIHR
jgi:hypothetical protein